MNSKVFSGRNDGLHRNARGNTLPPYLQLEAGLMVAKFSLTATALVLLAGDVSLNPGPFVSDHCKCGFSLKSIHKRQPRLSCTSCKRSFHLHCLGDDFEISHLCRFCADAISSDESDRSFLPEFHNFTELRGLKIIH